MLPVKNNVFDSIFQKKIMLLNPHLCSQHCTRVGTLIVATIYLQLIQN